ncbi:MAG TPA: excinuclease ABC subunit UvrC, partial [Bacillota bacterium]|nr:excinuclease ABC subunit UvrC [Bacillota bacterium]
RLVRELSADMKKASEEMLFEKAAIIRDRIKSVELVGAMQKIVMEPGDEADAIGIAGALSDVCVAVITVRDGRVVGKAHFFLEGASEGAKGEALSAFIKQYYASSSAAPPSIALPEQPEGAKELEDWLSSREGRKVRIAVPKRGVRRDIVLMAEENAEEMLRLRLAEEERMRARTQGAVQALADAIALPAPPYRIECFDISNIQGTNTVASMVVFEDGLPARKEYRRFRIRSVEGPDDFASMAEAVGRRFRKAKEEDPKFSRLPGLLLIDGGKGQLAAALEAMRKEGFDLPAAGLAKREEEIFLPDRQDPVLLGRDDYALHLLQRVRDEAHRFAVTYHRSIRGKKSIKSELSELPGIGRARLVALMKAFGSLAGLAKADVEAIRAVKGMNIRSAKAVWSHLHEGKEVAAYDGGDGKEKG